MLFMALKEMDCLLMPRPPTVLPRKCLRPTRKFDFLFQALTFALALFVSCQMSYTMSFSALTGLQIYYLFGLLWTYNFIIACGQIVIAGSIGAWYWTRDKKSFLPKGMIARSIYRLARYHLGTAALGSLILGVVQFIKLTILAAQQQAKKSKNRVAQHLLTCLTCLVSCCETVITYLSKNAYIEVSARFE